MMKRRFEVYLPKYLKLLIHGLSDSGKCVTSDTRVLSIDGRWETIEDIVKWGYYRPAQVFGRWQNSPIKEGKIQSYYVGGIKPILEITTNLGRKIKVTHVHPLLKQEGNNSFQDPPRPKWVEAQALRIGDKIGVMGNVPVFGSIAPPDIEIKLLAYFLTEGSLGGATPGITTTSDFIAKEINEAAIYFGTRIAFGTTSKNKVPTYQFMGHDGNRSRSPVKEWLIDKGIWGCHAATKHLPEEVFSYTKEKLALFLSRMWVGDGTLGKDGRGAEFCTASERMARGMQHLLLRFGILSRLVGNPHRNGNVYWRLHVPFKGGLDKFLEDIPMEERFKLIAQKTRNRRLGMASYQPKTYIFDRIVDIKEGLAQPVYDLSMGSASNPHFIANDVIAHNTVIASGARNNHPFGGVVDGVLFGDVDGGMVTLASMGILVERWPRDPKLCLSSVEQLEEMKRYVLKEKRFKVVAIDTITRLQERMHLGWLEKRGPGVRQMEVRDWGYELIDFIRLGTSLPDWGCHVVVTAHSTPKIDPADRGAGEKYQPALQGRFASMAMGYFDVFAYYMRKDIEFKNEKGEIESKTLRRLYFHPHSGMITRTKISILPPYMDNPDLPTILDTYEARRKELIEKTKSNPDPNLDIVVIE